MGHCSSRNCKLEAQFERFNIINNKSSEAPVSVDLNSEDGKVVDHRPVFMSNDTSFINILWTKDGISRDNHCSLQKLLGSEGSQIIRK